MGHIVYVKNKKTKAGEPGHWNEKKRVEVLTTYLATGSLSITVAMTGVPKYTVVSWMRQDWWKEQVKDIQTEENLQLDSKLTKVMDKALEAVMDRLEGGEYVYDNKLEKIVRVPAKLRDVQKVAVDMVDKRQLLKKVGKEKEDNKQTITADHLLQLAAEFAKFASGKVKEEAKEVTSVIEGEQTEIFESLGLEQT